jgi:PAS domain S-box-containing protein
MKKRGADLQRTIDALLAESGERRRAEEALRASEQRLQDILDNTTAVVFVKDLDLRYLLVNREYERRHQVQREQIRGKTDFDILPRDVAETVRANDRHVIEAGAPIQFEEAVPMAEGERQYVVVKFLLRDRTNKPYAVCGIATERSHAFGRSMTDKTCWSYSPAQGSGDAGTVNTSACRSANSGLA